MRVGGWLPNVQGDIGTDIHTAYFISVTMISGNESWRVGHRYSEFWAFYCAVYPRICEAMPQVKLIPYRFPPPHAHANTFPPATPISTPPCANTYPPCYYLPLTLISTPFAKYLPPGHEKCFPCRSFVIVVWSHIRCGNGRIQR